MKNLHLFIGVFIVASIFNATRVTYAQDEISMDAAIGGDPSAAFFAPDDLVLDTSATSSSFGDLTGFRNVIVVQAHPDDEWLMFIPIYRLAAQGADIHFYVLTHGEATSLDNTNNENGCIVDGVVVDTCIARVRRAEMRESASDFDSLGDGNVFLSWRNLGDFRVKDPATNACWSVAETVEKWQSRLDDPDSESLDDFISEIISKGNAVTTLVLALDPRTGGHNQHRAVGREVMGALTCLAQRGVAAPAVMFITAVGGLKPDGFDSIPPEQRAIYQATQEEWDFLVTKILVAHASQFSDADRARLAGTPSINRRMFVTGPNSFSPAVDASLRLWASTHTRTPITFECPDIALEDEELIPISCSAQ
jgi:LmbE family N-acetylglucosaminyl deacetylase